MRSWAVLGLLGVWVGLAGCVDDFPEVAPNQGESADMRPDAATVDGATPDAQVDASPDAAPPPDADLPPLDLGPDAAPDAGPICQPSEEICNGVDDDCDDAVDEQLPRQPCPLIEGVCAGVTVGCVEGAFGECNYGLAIAEYEVEETACDGLDNDCDGQTDEPCACSPGDEQACGVTVGGCEAGVQVCGDDGRFGDCMGQIGADVETCNGIDDDCDGATDEETEGACQTGELGRCAPGVGRCVDGQFTCERERDPVVEACNGADDNCNGVADEGLSGAPCRTGQAGICGDGVSDCTVDGLRCNTVIRPGDRAEVCNGLDDDCDGVVDDLPPAECATGNFGECAPGRQVCNGGRIICEGLNMAEPESCDGLDNDCDGRLDESVPSMPCVPEGELGACGMGATSCRNGVLICVAPNVGPDICDGVDTDCDGQIDEDVNLGQRCDTMQPQCPNGVRACVDGVDTCTLVALPGVNDVGPDGVDDDCDGVIDEGRLTLYLEDLMMGGDGVRPGEPTGFIPGYPQRVVLGNGAINPDSPEPFIDRLFRPNADGRGVQISSTGLAYDFSSDVGSALSWTPPAKGPVEYLDNDANVPPNPGTFIIEMHANIGMTFDLDVIRARYPDRTLNRFRGRVGSRARGEVQLELLIDGQSVFKSNCISRRDRNRSTLETISAQSLVGRRFLTLVSMDCGNNNIDMRHGFFYDARIELEPN